MIQTSAAFHEAVKENNPQRALLRFGNTIFTNEDIAASGGGLRLEEMFNSETDLTLGATPSSTLLFSIFNEGQLLDSFDWGEFTAYIGVLTESGRYEPEGTVTAVWRGERVFSGHDSAPYLRENGAACRVQPDFPVESIVIDGNTVYCFGGEARVFAFRMLGSTWDGQAATCWAELAPVRWDRLTEEYTVLTEGDGTGTETGRGTVGFNAFMWDKISRAREARRGIAREGDIIREFYPDGRVEVYEYAKLGVFTCTRPANIRQRIVSVEASDRMQRFDTSAEGLKLRYPATLKRLLQALCAFVDVPLRTGEFINSGRVLYGEPAGLADMTARELLGLIAEAAGCMARFDREGALELAWFTETGVTFDEGDYSSFVPGEYRVAPIDKLQVKNSDSDIGTILGEGENAYVIQENPFLYAGTVESGQLAAAPIYDRLRAWESLCPADVELWTDWSYQAGDIVQIQAGDRIYRLPIYSQSLSWCGGARATYQSTGNPAREPVSAVNRRLYQQGRTSYELRTDLNGLFSQVLQAEGDIIANRSLIQQTAEEITAQVEDVAGDLRASIKINAEAIQQRVEKSGVISAINQSAEKITIESNKIDLKGYVTISSLIEKGQTKINGANIITGSIDADKINVKDLQAFKATIGGWNIGTGEISYGTDGLNEVVMRPIQKDRLDLGVIFVGTRTQTSENFSYPFRVNGDGSLLATNATIAGTIRATDGYIGDGKSNGWNIGAKAIYNGTSSMTSNTKGTYLGTDGIRQYASGSAYVDIQNGVLTAKGANISGSFNATSGTIGGWSIASNNLSYGLDGTRCVVIRPIQSAVTDGVIFVGTRAGTSDGWTYPFRVNGDGSVVATAVTITGTVNANSSSSLAGKLNNVTGSLSEVTGSYKGSIDSDGTFTGTHSWGSLSNVGGSFTGTHSGGELSGTSGAYYGNHYNGVVSSCNLGGTSLSTGKGNAYFNSSLIGAAQVYGSMGSYLTGGTGNLFICSESADFNCNLRVDKNLTCLGTISGKIATVNYGMRQLDAVETPFPTFSDYGTAMLDGEGVCFVNIDPVFSETVDQEYMPSVFLTGYGNGNVWFSEAESTHDVIVVRGTPGLRFAWETRYARANASTERLRVMEFDQPDLSGEADFDGEANVDLEHSTIDYAQKGYEYYTEFERSIEAA